ncbi:PaaI family thioesterase [Oscillibacter valericigenes]|uniref:PaaI family thioesterase n=1 Tax=Oscillibacter valericigenes TaxID=351091 RepID=A0ABS2FVN2_9FIRM|nr:PaaI family thioesterase [Oscillibacter valericigenes]MBM6851707.1 PaaI family thioesterase [Oscillibacter valericigenes]MBM6909241.1 PaaI family thioesterase [Oscillibacter valericigenes]
MEESQELLEKATRERIRKNGFMLHNHIELESVERDRAVFKLDIRPESCNPYGMVHGGAIYTLADNATGTAAHSDGRYYVTQTSALHFLRNQSRGTVRATAWVRHRGKSTVLTSVDITGEDGKLLATGEFTFFCVDKSLMDQKVAAEQK